MDIFSQRRPLTPEQRLRMAQQRFASGAQQPMSIGQGIQQLGNGLALGIARNQYNEGKLPHEQASSGVRRITEALLNNQAPWQFPGAPQAPQQQQNEPWQPQPSDKQPTVADPRPWEAIGREHTAAPGNAPSPQFNLSNMFAGLFGRRGPTGGGLY